LEAIPVPRWAFTFGAARRVHQQVKVNMPHSKTTHLLSVAQVARRLDVSEQTVRALERDGELAAVRIGRAVRFEEAELDEFIERHRVEAA
jgi:excisionase family DNA binding protein